MVIEFRTCKLCKRRQLVYDDIHTYLFQYSDRAYAHAECLARRHGAIAASEMIRRGRDEFFAWLRVLDEDGWERSSIDVKDRQERARRAKQGIPCPTDEELYGDGL